MATQVSDLTPLEQVKGLHRLYLKDTQVSDLTPLVQIKELKVLFLNGTQVSDLKPLSQIKGLLRLHLNDTQVYDIAPLAKIKGLARLYLKNTQVSDLTPLKWAQELLALNIDNTKVSNIAPLAQIKRLQVLSLRNSDVYDLRPLSSLQLKITPDSEFPFASLFFKDSVATRRDSELKRLSEIEDDEERTAKTLAYLRSLPADKEALPAQSDPNGATAKVRTAKNQIQFILSHAAASKMAAETTASQIRAALRDVPSKLRCP